VDETDVSVSPVMAGGSVRLGARPASAIIRSMRAICAGEDSSPLSSRAPPSGPDIFARKETKGTRRRTGSTSQRQLRNNNHAADPPIGHARPSVQLVLLALVRLFASYYGEATSKCIVMVQPINKRYHVCEVHRGFALKCFSLHGLCRQT
jgi:hypothetical protein